MRYLRFCKVVHGDLRAVGILVNAASSACVFGLGLPEVVREVNERVSEYSQS